MCLTHVIVVIMMAVITAILIELAKLLLVFCSAKIRLA